MSLSILIFDIIGTIAFAISGAVVAIEKKMDLLGVVILGVITAVGGGIIRDITLGITPPNAFRSSYDIIIATITAIITFIVIWIRSTQNPYTKHYFALLLFVSDTVGLGVFTVMGVQTALEKVTNPSDVLLIFVGVITGVGGGVIRDLLAGNIPYIFKKHIYASACILGSIVCMLCWSPFGKEKAMLFGALCVVLIRVLASHYKWNLPRINR